MRSGNSVITQERGKEMAQERILIIEDDKALADILEYNLVREG